MDAIYNCTPSFFIKIVLVHVCGISEKSARLTGKPGVEYIENTN